MPSSLPLCCVYSRKTCLVLQNAMYLQQVCFHLAKGYLLPTDSVGANDSGGNTLHVAVLAFLAVA
jgi:hypothetical protein